MSFNHFLLIGNSVNEVINDQLLFAMQHSSSNTGMLVKSAKEAKKTIDLNYKDLQEVAVMVP